MIATIAIILSVIAVVIATMSYFILYSFGVMLDKSEYVPLDITDDDEL